MGNTHSTPRIDRERTKRPIMGRRKLSKPRVGNHSGRGDLSIPCLPPAPVIISGRVSKPTNGTTQGINRSIPRQLVVSEVPGIPSSEDGIVPLNCGSTRSRRHSLSHQQFPPVSHSRNPSLTGSYQDYPLPLTKYNSSRNTALYSNDKPNGLDQSHPPLSVMRRRSLIAAAPPATQTRRQPTLILEGGIPAPPLLALNLSEANKVQTPSGYSVLGGFKRGSLRIVNTTASPAPSPQDLFPKRRNTSPAHPKTPSCSVLMVAPTPQITLEPHENEGYFGYHGTLPVSGGQETDTPLSFRTAPEGIFCSNDEFEADSSFKKTPTPALARSSNHELDSSKLSGTAGEPKDMPIVRNTSSSSNLHFNFSGTRDTMWHAYKKPAPRPSVKSSTDSGYCSTGSIRSLASCFMKASDGDLQHGSEITNIVSARLDSPFNSPQEPPTENSNDASRTIMEVVEDGVFSKYADKYPQTTVTEGSIIEHMLPSRTRKPSLSSGGHVFCS